MTPRQWRRVCSLDSIASLENLFAAAWNARRGKSRRPVVEAWWGHRGEHLGRLAEVLLSGEWKPGGYRTFEIREPKRRLIAAAPFEDRVVHHALCQRLAPVLEHRFIARSFSCQVGKGTTAARECCRRLTNRHRWVLKCDVRKFFASMDHAVLLEKLSRWIACPGAMALIRSILDSHRDDQIPPALFPGDDWVDTAARPRGLPIGNLTSQLWGNFYLDDLDHWVTQGERHGDYLRYTDDFLLFGDDRARLWELHEGVVTQLARVRLKLAEPKSRLLEAREGVPFCGFRFLPGQAPRILGPTKRRFEHRRYALWRRGNPARLSLCVQAWYAFSVEGNTEGLRRAYGRWPLCSARKRRTRRTKSTRCSTDAELADTNSSHPKPTPPFTAWLD